MNKYLDYLKKPQLRLKTVKIQQKSFLENVISNADYKFLKRQLKKDGNMEWYFVVWYLADLMGHESIETTRIYLRRTASEQQAIVDKIVTW